MHNTKQATMDRIVDSAIELIARSKTPSTRDIAKKAKVSHSLVSQYYPHKRLFSEVYKKILIDFCAQSEGLINPKSTSYPKNFVEKVNPTVTCAMYWICHTDWGLSNTKKIEQDIIKHIFPIIRKTALHWGVVKEPVPDNVLLAGWWRWLSLYARCVVDNLSLVNEFQNKWNAELKKLNAR